MHAHIQVESIIVPTPRLTQAAGLFDLTLQPTSRLEWDVNLPLEQHPWSIGLITGPSGCGKSTIARTLWPRETNWSHDWPRERSLLDAFPAHLSIKDITALLSAVGFASPPAWLRPFHVLSTGQQFRATLARLLAESPQLAVMDEYTSVVDRTVAQIGSAALAKTVRARGQKFIAVTCHDDVIPWLQPDWIYDPAANRFDWRRLRRRPAIPLHVFRCRASAWSLFAAHHYLSHSLAVSAICFLAVWNERPVAFSSWLPFVSPGPPTRREHRTVTLPDFQGVGIGNAVSALIASMWKALGFRAISTTTHPAMIRARQRSPLWRMHRPPSLAHGRERRLTKLRHATTRLTAGFEYIGPAMPAHQAPRSSRLLIPVRPMSHSIPSLTPELQGQIVTFVRAGGYPHVAAEAAGVPRRTFENWLRRGTRRKARQPYRGFAAEVTRAAAQARLRAEIAIFDKRPLDWLKCGPAKETSRRPGWSAAPKAQAAPRIRDGNPLADPAVQRILANLLDALTPFPEVRDAVAEKLPELTQSRRRRAPDAGL